MSYEHREAWLSAAVEHFKPDFAANGYPLKNKVRVACGWPSRGALAPKSRTIGQCFSTKVSADGANEIFISPIIDDPITVGATLVHELTHAAVGIQYGHQGPFRSLATKMGLTGPMRATTAGPLLTDRLNALSQKLGLYPHATLNPKVQDWVAHWCFYGTHMQVLARTVRQCSLRKTMRRISLNGNRGESWKSILS